MIKEFFSHVFTAVVFVFIGGAILYGILSSYGAPAFTLLALFAIIAFCLIDFRLHKIYKELKELNERAEQKQKKAVGWPTKPKD